MSAAYGFIYLSISVSIASLALAFALPGITARPACL